MRKHLLGPPQAIPGFEVESMAAATTQTDAANTGINDSRTQSPIGS